MSIQINKELNDIFETTLLIYSYYHPESMLKEEFLIEIRKYGVDGEEIFKKFENTIKKYCSEFQKNMVKSENDDYFFGTEEHDIFVIFLNLLLNNKDWMDEEYLKTIEDRDLVFRLLKELTEEDINEDIEMGDIIKLLNSERLPDHLCWRLILALQSPKEYIIKFTSIIKLNLPVYKKALSKVSKQVSRLLDKFSRLSIEDFKITNFNIEDDSVDMEITPTLIQVVSETIFSGNKYFIGLYTDEFIKELKNKKNHNDNLIMILKSLGDGSKFKVLCSLKDKPKYNLEIAKDLGLSAATTSHHMGVLLTYKFVNAEKRNGKVYYTIDKNKIKEFIKNLEEAFI